MPKKPSLTKACKQHMPEIMISFFEANNVRPYTNWRGKKLTKNIKKVTEFYNEADTTKKAFQQAKEEFVGKNRLAPPGLGVQHTPAEKIFGTFKEFMQYCEFRFTQLKSTELRSNKYDIQHGLEDHPPLPPNSSVREFTKAFAMLAAGNAKGFFESALSSYKDFKESHLEMEKTHYYKTEQSMDGILPDLYYREHKDHKGVMQQQQLLPPGLQLRSNRLPPGLNVTEAREILPPNSVGISPKVVKDSPQI